MQFQRSEGRTNIAAIVVEPRSHFASMFLVIEQFFSTLVFKSEAKSLSDSSLAFWSGASQVTARWRVDGGAGYTEGVPSSG